MPHPALRVTLFLFGYLLILLIASIPKNMTPPQYADVVWGSIASLGLLALTQFVLVREHRRRSEIGLAADAHTLARFGGGVVVGVVVYGVTMALLSFTLGPIDLVANARPSATTWLVVVASFLALATMEELGFRGYPLRTLIASVGVWPAQFAIAVAFGLSHRAFGWAWWPILVGVIPSALLFGAVAVRSGGLAMPIGVHAALNVAQWMVGAKSTPGVWTLRVDPAHAARMTDLAPFVGMAVTLLAATVIARWPTRTRVGAKA